MTDDNIWFSDENNNIRSISQRPPGYTSQSQVERDQVIILGKYSTFLGSDYSKIRNSRLHQQITRPNLEGKGGGGEEL